MSQTLQSIHSLSMQLNRAASMQDHLNEICQSPLDHGSAEQASELGAGAGASGRLSQLVGKKARRVKEVLLQNFGKADKTRDDLFHMYEKNFYKQQEYALKLQKEFKSYLQSLEGAQTASKSLNRCIQQSTGEYQSARHDLVCENLSQMEHLNEDLIDKLRGQILINFGEYLSQFGEMRNKIAKRHRKLIDYDSSRRHYEQTLANVNKKRRQQEQESQVMPGTGSGLQSATSQLIEEARLLKLREQFNYCKVMYEAINNELHEQLPMVYEKKMKNLLLSLQNYFSLEAQFHSNVAKLFATAGDVIDELPMSIGVKQQQHQELQKKQQSHHQVKMNRSEEANSDEDYSQAQAQASSSSGMGSSRAESSLESSSSSPGNCSPEMSPETQDVRSEIEEMDPLECQQQISSCQDGSEFLEESEKSFVSKPACAPSGFGKSAAALKPVDEEAPEDVAEESAELDTSKPKEGTQAVPAGTVKGFLYKVKTNFKYLAEDVDELCFEADEIIQVVEQEDESQEPEEGWLIGVREVNGQRGLFPANFTYPL